MKKRILAIILSLAMACSLFAGCKSTTPAADNTASGSGSANAAQKAIDDRIANAKKNGKYQTVVMAFMNWAGSPKDIQKVSAAISQYTEKKLGLDVKLQILDAATYKQQMTLMLSSGEQVDLFNATMMGYTSCVSNGYTLDLEKDKLISTYGPDIVNAVGKKYVDDCRVNGILYGLPENKNDANSLDCISIGKQYLDGIGFKYASMYKNKSDEVIHTNLDTINSIFAQLHKKYPNKFVFSPQALTVVQANDFDGIGGDSFGVLLNKGQDLKVTDLFTSETYKKFCTRIYNWNKAGYISKDALSSSLTATAAVKAGTAMSYATAGKPGIKTQESNLCGQEMIIFQLGENFLSSGAVATMPWCINSSTKDAVAAMQFLNLAYSDPVVSNYLCWGIEGTHYVKTSDGHIDFPQGVNPGNSGYYNNVNWEMPNQFIAKIWKGDSLDIWTRMKEFNDTAITSKATGFTFDNSSLTTEYTALTNVYNQYQKQIEFGFVNPDTGIADMEAKLKSNGLEKYMAEKQTQLDKWAKAHASK